jgi:hypothetical protein
MRLDNFFVEPWYFVVSGVDLGPSSWFILIECFIMGLLLGLQVVPELANLILKDLVELLLF